MSRFKSQDVEENVACNLIPMIDIMFLLLLFFMLSADMTQRVAEDMVLPVADRAKEDVNKQDNFGTTVVNIVEEPPGSWVVKIRSKAYPDWGVLKAELAEIAKSSPPDPANKPGENFSSQTISIRCEANAPYKEAQRLIQLCGQVNLYKIELVAVKTPPEPTKS